MVLSKRQVEIIGRIGSSPDPIKVKDLAGEIGVTVQTIYNDLHRIEDLRFRLDRGRIGLSAPEVRDSTVSRKIWDHRALREKACDYVIDEILSGGPRGTFFIDGGSTGYLFFESLRKRRLRDLVILSSNPLIMGSIHEDEGFFYQNSVYLTGGRIDPARISLYAIARRGELIPSGGDGAGIDVCILGVRSISEKGELYIGNEEEVAQKKTLISRSRRVVLILTPEKLGTTGLFKIGSLPGRKEGGIFNIVVAGGDSLGHAELETVKSISEILGPSSVKLL